MLGIVRHLSNMYLSIHPSIYLFLTQNINYTLEADGQYLYSMCFYFSAGTHSEITHFRYH